MSDDFYCDCVLSGKTAVSVVAESARVLAFEHTAPTWEIHIVVIPKAHVRRLVDVEDPGLIVELFGVMTTIVKERGFAESNYKIITNGGSYQSTQHLHFHLVSGSPLNPSNPAQSGEMLV
ncbi:HIT domain-containing protein [Jeongeupia naejangsanensis]|uniref:HIT domain-containing protein n=1 Tax=Jeongeupia naejangsanensis TaxID=613195 RepID=A0ABS2BLJ0_9NEIS|nr:HIT domain-containing protein [Jeongeupia naejangsanensis]MBM3116478.1 HIT domain-containing protein [Jeongeupia naejangsanensis]